MRRYIIIVFLLFAVIYISGAEGLKPRPFKTMGVAQGLPSTVTNCSYQDEFGMVWIGTQDGLARYDGNQITVFRPGSEAAAGLFNNNIRTVTGDRNGHIYIVAKFALCEYDMRKEKFRTLKDSGIRSISYGGGKLWAATSDSLFFLDGSVLEPFCKGSGPEETINAISAGENGVVIGTDKGVYSVDGKGAVAEKKPGLNIFSIYRSKDGNIWACSRNDGVWLFPAIGEPIHLYREGPKGLSLSSNYVRTVCEDGYGSFWISTANGLDIYDAIRHKVEMVPSSHSIYGIMLDSQNSIWMCGNNGLTVYNKEHDLFRNYGELFDEYSGILVRAILYHPDRKTILVGSGRDGLLQYDASAKRFKPFLMPGGVRLPQNVTTLNYDSATATLYVSTQFSGLLSVNDRTGQSRHYNFHPNNNVQSSVPYGKDSLIVSTGTGVVVMSLRTGQTRSVCSHPMFAGKYATAIYLDREENCWIGTSDGILKVNMRTAAESPYFTENDSLLGTSHATCFYQDDDGDIWIGTSGSGVIHYSGGGDSFFSLNSANSAIPSDFIIGIGGASGRSIQIAHSTGYCKFDTEKQQFQEFGPKSLNPLDDVVMNGFCTNGREVYLCGNDAMISFDESRIVPTKAPGEIYLTNLHIDGDEFGSLLYKSRIDLYERDKVISVRTSMPDYLSSNTVRYRIREMNDNYLYARPGEAIVYSNLRPGTWHLDVQCVDQQSSEVSASRTLTIRVHQKWFRSWPMIILYVLIIAGVIIYLIALYITRVRMQSQIESKESKLNFFTYISHEIRTPVTLIQSSVEGLLKKSNVHPSIYNKVVSMQRNLDRINSLLGELLDFRKQEAKMISICFANGNFIDLLDRTAVVFKEYSNAKEIEFSFENNCGESVPLWYDEDQMDKVLYNLLSNAFKNTPKGGSIRLIVSQSETRVIIKVTDTGVGIPKKYIDSIFTPFFQVAGNENSVMGTGLGLAITKGIIEGHGGTIECESVLGSGSTFTISLLKGDSHFPADAKRMAAAEDVNRIQEESGIPDSKFFDSVKQSQGENMPKILIVEDNDDLRDYLKSIFEPIYSVTTASDGMEALSKLKADPVDIILSDLMMPNMDGNELCAKVRGNLSTSHIPFVILTAKTSQESTLESLKNGVDDYITKPFNSKILISKCNNIVNTRINLQEKFAKSLGNESSAVLATNKMDDEFIRKAMDIVNENIMNSNFGVEEFAFAMAMGRTALFSKIKGVTGQTPNKFITTVKLKKALELLKNDPDISTNEVSYMSGFSSPSYFIKTFKAVYGITPSAYKSSL